MPLENDLEAAMLADLAPPSSPPPVEPPVAAPPEPVSGAAPAAPTAPPVPTPAPAPAPAPTPPSVLERLTKLGVEGFENEDEALEFVVQRARLAEEQAGWAGLGLRFNEFQQSQEWKDYQEYLRTRGNPAAAAGTPTPGTAAPAAPSWQSPDFDPDWLELVYRNDDGELVSKSGVDPMLPQKIRAWQQFQLQQQVKFLRNPGEFMNPFVEQKLSTFETKLNELVEQRLAAALQQREVEQFTRTALDEVESWAWEKHPNGSFLQDATGRRVLSADGHKYNAALSELASLPPDVRHRYALQSIGRGPGSKPAPAAKTAAAPAAPPPPTPAQVNDAAKEEFTNRIPPGGGYNPPRAGSFSAGGSLTPTAQNDKEVDESNLEAMMLADLKAQAA